MHDAHCYRAVSPQFVFDPHFYIYAPRHDARAIDPGTTHMTHVSDT